MTATLRQLCTLKPNFTSIFGRHQTLHVFNKAKSIK